jgi:predicted short-subunit dehydrogenase-like oxidoreductase (DUF2520 family)
LGRKCKAAGHHIAQVYSRNASAASTLAYEWDTESTNYKSLVTQHGDVYLIAVPDDAIADVLRDLELPGKVVAHTAASVPMDILKPVTAHYGVFYPLQSLRKEMSYLPDIPIYFEGVDDKSKKTLSRLAHSISGDQAVQANGDERIRLHVAAVVVSNFTNHLYALAEEYCRREGLDFRKLLPLIEETARRVQQVSPRETQTGPAARQDEDTIQKHLRILETHPKLKKIYVAITESIRS